MPARGKPVEVTLIRKITEKLTNSDLLKELGYEQPIRFTVGAPDHAVDIAAIKANIEISFIAAGSRLNDAQVGDYKLQYTAKKEHPGTSIPYTDFAGVREFREEYAKTQEKIYNLELNFNNVAFAAGATGAGNALFKSIIKKDEPVITHGPGYTLYKATIENNGGVYKVIDTTEDNFQLIPEKVENALIAEAKTQISRKTEKLKKKLNNKVGKRVLEKKDYDDLIEQHQAKVNEVNNKKEEDVKATILLNFITNPTGVLLNEENTKGIAKILNKYKNVNLILDDIYEDMIYDKSKKFNLVDYLDNDAKKRVFIIKCSSKGQAMPGKRVSSVFSLDEEAMSKVATNIFNNTVMAPIDSQAAFVAAEKARNEERDAYVNNHYGRRIDFIYDGLNKADNNMVPSKPEGAFYVRANYKKMLGIEMHPKAIEIYNNNFAEQGKEMYIGDKISDGLQATVSLFYHTGMLIVPYEAFEIPGKDSYNPKFDEKKKDLFMRVSAVGSDINMAHLVHRTKEFFNAIDKDTYLDMKASDFNNSKPKVKFQMEKAPILAKDPTKSFASEHPWMNFEPAY